MSNKNNYFDREYYTKRNKQLAIEKYGNKLDANKNIAGTSYYFDSNWCLCKKNM